MKSCCNCNKESTENFQFWDLNGYYGFSGTWCCDCYTKIAHDGYGNPKHPQEYLMMLLKQEKRNEKTKGK